VGVSNVGQRPSTLEAVSGTSATGSSWRGISRPSLNLVTHRGNVDSVSDVVAGLVSEVVDPPGHDSERLSQSRRRHRALNHPMAIDEAGVESEPLAWAVGFGLQLWLRMPSTSAWSKKST
jgi:hypothetical protein